LSDTTSIPPIAAKMQTRLRFWSGSMLLVSQLYAHQAHQTAARISRPSPRLSQPGLWAIFSVTWVNERTKTRSKNSSRGVTRSSPALSTPITRVSLSMARFYHTSNRPALSAIGGAAGVTLAGLRDFGDETTSDRRGVRGPRDRRRGRARAGLAGPRRRGQEEE